MADPKRFDADPDPKISLARERKNLFFQILQILQNLSFAIFSVTMREDGRGVRDKV